MKENRGAERGGKGGRLPSNSVVESIEQCASLTWNLYLRLLL